MASLLVAQAVAQAHQAVAQVNVLHYHIGVGNGEVVVGEVPEALDAQVHQTAADLLGTVAGHTEHGHLGVVLGAEDLQLVHMTDLDAVDLLAHLVLGHIKGGDELVSRLGVHRKADRLIRPDMDVFEVVREASQATKLACVLCDESQFFTAEQAEQLFMVTVDLNIPVICYGLRADFSLRGFPGSTRLLELAHTIEEMKTICTCGRKAICNCRKVNGQFVFEGEQVAIDLENDVQYVSMCPQCYFRARRAFYAGRK